MNDCSVSNSHWSIEFVCSIIVALKVGASIDSVWRAHLDTVFVGHSRDLDVIMCLLVTVEHDLEAVLHDFLGLSLGHVSSPRILHEDLAVMQSKTSEKEVSLDLGAMVIRSSKENLIILLVDSSDNAGNPDRISLQSLLILALSNKIVVISWMEECSTVILDKVVLILLVNHFLKVLHVSHLSGTGKDCLITAICHSAGVLMLEHTTVGDVRISGDHNTVFVLHCEDTGSNVDWSTHFVSSFYLYLLLIQ